MTYKYSPITSENLQALIVLLDSVFSIQNKNKESLIMWKYYHPFFKGLTFQQGVFLGDQIVSHYANVPIEIEGNNTVFKGAICTDMSTHPLHRGKGLISNLSKIVYTNIKASNVKVSIGFSNEAGVQVDKYSKNYGYTIIGKFQSYYTVPMRTQTTDYKLIKITSFSDKTHSLTPTYFSIHKTNEYLNWRYKDNPNNGYLFYKIIENDNFAGYVILKSSRFKTYVIDIVTNPSQPETMRNIMKAINNDALHEKKRLIIYCVLENSFWSKIFKKAFSFKRGSKKNAYYLTVKLHDPEISEKGEILNKDHWLCFVGDIL